MAANANRTAMPKDSSVKSYRDTNYRDKPATPNSPSGTTVTTMYDHMLSPSSPAADMEEKDGRLRNDLLDEICNDMGIDDSMDLDFDDFCYNGQQRSGTSQNSQRFGQSGSGSAGPNEGRRQSVTGSSSYSTSDSLCAIAKLTHSIASENATMPAEADGKPRSPDCSSVKQEPCDVETDQISSSNDTDQGKAAASKLTLHKQMSDSGSSSSDLKRKREIGAPELNSDSANVAMSVGMLGSLSHSQPVVAAASQRCQPETYPDYSYQDDFPMDDPPDTMINFSELPQQPNYYQCPQTAGDSLNLGFNMSLQQPGSTGFAGSLPSSIPPAHQHAQTHHVGRTPFGGTLHHNPHELNVGRSSPQPRLPNSVASQGHMAPPHGGSFQPYPEAGSMSTPSLQRSESFPGAQPGTSHFQSAVPTSPPQTPKSASVSAHQSTAGLGSTSQRNAPSTPSTGAARTAASNGSNSQQDFLQQLISDSSSAFRSHPLFPLLRDLIIADVNFREKSFPHKLIVNLPSDFNKLLKNYLSRNPPKNDYQCMQSVESVLMDALKYAHHILIEKINQWKHIQQTHERQRMDRERLERDQMERHQLVVSTHAVSAPDGSALTAPMSRPEYCDGSSKLDMTQAGYGRTPMTTGKPSATPLFRPSRRETGSVYGSDLGPPTPSSTYSQPLSVDTGSADSPSSSRHSTPLGSQPPSNMYTAGQGMPHYPPSQHPLQIGYSRSPNPRNPYMPAHGGPPCPPPNYTVSPNNPPLSRHQQTLYEMGPPPSGPGVYNDPNSTYHDPYNSCMPPPPAAHHPRLHHMAPADRQLMYMNNINDGTLVKAMMEGGKDMYENISDSASVMSGHSMQGSVKGQQQGQNKPTEGRKHASLPKEAVNIMLNWLREHQDKPYPNDDEKAMLIKQTGLSITQINYWFTNARRRLLPKWRGEDM